MRAVDPTGEPRTRIRAGLVVPAVVAGTAALGLVLYTARAGAAMLLYRMLASVGQLPWLADVPLARMGVIVAVLRLLS